MTNWSSFRFRRSFNVLAVCKLFFSCLTVFSKERWWGNWIHNSDNTGRFPGDEISELPATGTKSRFISHLLGRCRHSAQPTVREGTGSFLFPSNLMLFSVDSEVALDLGLVAHFWSTSAIRKLPGQTESFSLWCPLWKALSLISSIHRKMFFSFRRIISV